VDIGGLQDLGSNPEPQRAAVFLDRESFVMKTAIACTIGADGSATDKTPRIASCGVSKNRSPPFFGTNGCWPTELDRSEGIPEGDRDAHLARLKAEPE
jgi:hypothetical protein